MSPDLIPASFDTTPYRSSDTTRADARDYLHMAQSLWMETDVYEWISSQDDILRKLLLPCGRDACGNVETRVGEFKRCAGCFEVCTSIVFYPRIARAEIIPTRHITVVRSAKGAIGESISQVRTTYSILTLTFDQALTPCFKFVRRNRRHCNAFNSRVSSSPLVRNTPSIHTELQNCDQAGSPWTEACARYRNPMRMHVSESHLPRCGRTSPSGGKESSRIDCS